MGSLHGASEGIPKVMGGISGAAKSLCVLEWDVNLIFQPVVLKTLEH